MCKFSVLMSVYIKENPRFLDTALKSNLMDQTLVPNEMIIICDGLLTDELNDVILKYEELFPNIVRVYRLEENQGLGKALNYGLQKCSYNWVARSDSDDVCDKDRFKIQMEYVRNHVKVDVVGSFIDEFESEWNNPIHTKVLPLRHDEIVQFAKFRNPINHMSVLFKKSTIIKCGSYKHLPYIEDYYLWIRAIQSGARFANIDKCLVHARVGNGMMQRRSNKEYISSWKKVNKYMKSIDMISNITFLRNMFAVRVFIYIPVKVKVYIYKLLLRK